MGYTPHVLVVGGGVIGTGIARDLAIRGLDVTLVERRTLTAGATGRSLGVVYSGAREDDEQLARLTYRENQRLRRIAGHCIESTGGLLVANGDDAESTLDDRLDSIEAQSIPYEVVDGDSIRETEPGLAPDVNRAISVPDAVVDPNQLTLENARSAVEYGATIRTQTSVTDITVDGGTVGTVTIEHDPASTHNATFSPADEHPVADGGRPGAPGSSDTTNSPGETGPGTERTSDQSKQRSDPSTEELDPDYVVNAAGAWAGEVAELAGLDIELSLSAGTSVLLDSSPVNTVVTRCREATHDETISPRGEQAVVGTAREDVSDPSHPVVSPERTRELLDRLSAVVPDIEGERTLRWDWGVSARHASTENERAHRFLDHGNRDDCWGMTTVVGGSITTHRFVAEQLVDEICAKFGIQRECQTTDVPLPGSDDRGDSRGEPDISAQSPVVCDCKSITRAEIREALADETAGEADLEDVRIRTGATMGECQGGRCAHGIAAELYPEFESGVVTDTLDRFLDTHWGGQRYALCGSQLQRAMRTYLVQKETMNLGAPDATYVASKADDVEEALEEEDRTVAENTVSLAAFDDGSHTKRRDRPMWGERER